MVLHKGTVIFLLGLLKLVCQTQHGCLGFCWDNFGGIIIGIIQGGNDVQNLILVELLCRFLKQAQQDAKK